MPSPNNNQEQLSLGLRFLLPWGERKTLATTQEVAQVLAYSQDAVRDLVEQGRLEAHRDTVFGTSISRLTNRITTRSVLLWLAKTACYDPEAVVDALLAVARTLTPSLRERLIAGLTKQQRQ